MANNIIQYGSAGSAVMELQELLNKLGANLVPDGIFGPATQKAVEAYEAKVHVTGAVTDALLLKMKAEVAAEPKHPALNVKWIGDKCPNYSSRNGVDVDVLVYHFTTSTNINSTTAWFNNPSAKASAHFVIDYDGSIFQMVKEENSAWHVGGCTLPDGSHLANCRSIGVEIENWGQMLKHADGHLYNQVSGAQYDPDIHGPAFIDAKGHYWMPYTQEQVDACIALGESLDKHHKFKYIVSHEEIAIIDGSTLRFKSDTGPAFPLDRVRKTVIAAR